MPVRNLNFRDNGELLNAFKPKQENDTISFVCGCLGFIFLLLEYKCSSQRMKSRKKKTENRELTKGVTKSKLKRINMCLGWWQGKCSRVNTFCSEHNVILLIVTDLLFWLIYVVVCASLIIILLYFLLSGIWPKPTSSPSDLSDLQGKESLLSSSLPTCGQCSWFEGL